MGAKYRDIVQAHSQAKRGARAILNVIANYADNQGIAYPGYERIAADAGVTTRTVERQIKTLRDLGEIEILNGQTGPNIRREIRIKLNQTPDSLTDEHPTTCQVNTRQFDGNHPTVCHETPDSLAISPDSLSSDTIYRNHKEPTEEPRENRAPARDELPSPNDDKPTIPASNGNGSKRLRITSPHFQASDFVNGFIPAGAGRNAIQVYYERFDISHDSERLNSIQEDDLIRHCPDLERLREAITAYSRTSYRPGNVQLILDWYRDGAPQRQAPASFGSARYAQQMNGHNGNGYGNGRNNYRENGDYFEQPNANQNVDPALIEAFKVQQRAVWAKFNAGKL